MVRPVHSASTVGERLHFQLEELVVLPRDTLSLYMSLACMPCSELVRIPVVWPFKSALFHFIPAPLSKVEAPEAPLSDCELSAGPWALKVLDRVSAPFATGCQFLAQA